MNDLVQPSAVQGKGRFADYNNYRSLSYVNSFVLDQKLHREKTLSAFVEKALIFFISYGIMNNIILAFL